MTKSEINQKILKELKIYREYLIRYQDFFNNQENSIEKPKQLVK